MLQTDRLITQLSDLRITFYAYEKFGVLFKITLVLFLREKCTGLPERVRRAFTPAIGIREAGQHLSLYIDSLWEEKREAVYCSYGRAVAKIVWETNT